MYVFHVVLSDTELENIKRWAEGEGKSVEEYLQSMFNEQMVVQLEFEKGNK